MSEIENIVFRFLAIFSMEYVGYHHTTIEVHDKKIKSVESVEIGKEEFI